MKRKKENYIAGTLSKHRKGFGFVRPEDSESTAGRDIFIAPGDLKDAMNGDLVYVKLLRGTRGGTNLEGKITKVIKRGANEFVGTFQEQGNRRYVRPENRKEGEEAYVGKADSAGARHGDKVIVKITRWPGDRESAQGRIKEIISRKGERGGDVRALIRSFQIEETFSEKTMAETAGIVHEIRREDLQGRKDLRELTVFTIDGADAKDFDDAVSAERLGDGGIRLGVHIADVSHYVREGSALDKDAFRRGTSIYLADRVIPMLPFPLSDGICSLRPGEDRLTLSVFMDLDEKGRVKNHEIAETVIRSKERLIYTDISDLLEHGDPELRTRYGEILPDLYLMRDVAAVLTKKRKERGSLDFDFDEAHLTLDEAGLPIAVEIAERRTANRMIEEFMLLANETVAEHFFQKQTPFVYRVHEQPFADKIEEFRGFLQNMGLTLSGKSENIHPKHLNEILEQVAGTQAETVINTVMLRSMKKAAYDTKCLGHFGLGVIYYCHFTSPIRRYPDLMIHRIIKESMRGSIGEERRAALKQRTEDTASVSSAAERKAEELEREVEKLKKAQYMEGQIGEEFNGIISGVAPTGFFVQLSNTIEGMVRADTLTDDFYVYEAEKYRLIGRRHRITYTLGKEVRVRVVSVDLYAREIRFELV